MPDGKRVVRKCPECGRTCEFYECVEKRSVTVYSVIDVWEGERTAYACTQCCSVMQLEATHAPELSDRERRKLERKQQRELAAAKRDRERAEAAKQREIDAELEAIKRRLGK